MKDLDRILDHKKKDLENLCKIPIMERHLKVQKNYIFCSTEVDPAKFSLKTTKQEILFTGGTMQQNFLVCKTVY